MQIVKDTRLTILFAAAGLWMCFAPDAQAGCVGAACGISATKTSTAADGPVVLAKFSKRKAQAQAKTKSATRSAHAGHDAKTPDPTAKSKAADDAAPNLAALPPSVANARAELTPGNPQSAADDQTRNIAATDDNEVVTMDGVQIASADQLNDIDRAAPDEKPEVKSDEAPAMSALPATPSGRILKAAPTGERHVFASAAADPWSKTSLIGKIFVAFGSLLTLASAARLVIA